MMRNGATTNLDFALCAVGEWVYGQTGIEHSISEAWMVPNTEAHQRGKSVRILTPTVVISKARHPCALVIESLSLSITGSCYRPVEADDDITEKTRVDIEILDQYELMHDQGGFATLSVQHVLNHFDSNQSHINRRFIFRNGLLHKIL